MFIRMGLQIFYPLACYSMISLNKNTSPASSSLDVLKILICVTFISFTFVFMRKHKNDVDEKEFKERYGGFMTNCETYKKPAATSYAFLFLSRRLFLALTITTLQFNLVVQVLFAVNSSLMMLCWLIMVQPFDKDWKNYLECFNEWLILMMSYLGFWFSDFVGNPITRSHFGYAYLGLIALGLLVNMIVVLCDAIKSIVIYYRIWKLKKDHAKKRNDANKRKEMEQYFAPQIVDKKESLVSDTYGELI